MKHLCLFWQQILNTILYSQAQFFIHKTTIIYNYSQFLRSFLPENNTFVPIIRMF